MHLILDSCIQYWKQAYKYICLKSLYIHMQIYLSPKLFRFISYYASNIRRMNILIYAYIMKNVAILSYNTQYEGSILQVCTLFLFSLL